MLSALQRSRLPLIHEGATTPPFLSSLTEERKFQAKAAVRKAAVALAAVSRRGRRGKPP